MNRIKATPPPPPFVAKIQRLLSVEFLIVLVISLCCICLYLFDDDNFYRDTVFKVGFYIYFVIVVFRLTIAAIKTIFIPKS